MKSQINNRGQEDYKSEEIELMTGIQVTEAPISQSTIVRLGSENGKRFAREIIVLFFL
jgi:hypothetical protein